MKEINEKIFQLLNSNYHQNLDGFMLFISNEMNLLLVSFVICLIAYKNYKSTEHYHPTLNSLFFIIISHLLCLIPILILYKFIPAVLKITPPCLNPNLSGDIHLVGSECLDNYSPFPYRTFIITYFASFLLFTFKGKYKNVAQLLIVWALLVSYSRIYLGVHYPFSIILSAVTAVFTGYLSSKSFNKLNELI